MINYTVYCQTGAKKNMKRTGVSKNGKPYMYTDPRYAKWEKDVSSQLFTQKTANGFEEWDRECWAKIVIYRHGKREADLAGVIESVQDALERARCITNDGLIKSLDGSRIYHGVPKEEARFEVTLADFME